jgi:hypothetical protein
MRERESQAALVGLLKLLAEQELPAATSCLRSATRVLQLPNRGGYD